MSTARTSPNFSKIRLKMLSLGLTLSSFSACRGQNHLIGRLLKWIVSGRSPAFISSILRASRKNESQS
uniref:Putative secreted protein n=1 Tax=Anopheles darlingi TaxID=43151 RepID=A0A2M4DHZ6_ANODA